MYQYPPSKEQTSYVVGLDLGQVQDYTAAVILRRFPAFLPRGTRRPLLVWGYEVPEDVGLLRFARNTRYTAQRTQQTPDGGIAEQMHALLSRQPLPGALLAVDQTGVGRAVYDIFRKADFPCSLYGITITAGWHVRYSDQDKTWHVPKKDLVGAVQAVLQQRRIALPARHPLIRTLTEELDNFRVKITAHANETFASWRERDHDDLVLALAMALWLSERIPPIVRGSATSGGTRPAPPTGESLGGTFRKLPRGL